MKIAIFLSSVVLIHSCSDQSGAQSTDKAGNVQEQKKSSDEKSSEKTTEKSPDKPNQFKDTKGVGNAESSQTPEQPKASYEIRPVESEIHNLVNEHRKTRGLSPFAINTETFVQARIHSENMAKSVTPFGHQGFNDRVKLIFKSLGRPALMAGENVAYVGSLNAASNALRSWLGSAGHRDNIEGDFTHTGLGVSQNPSGNLMFTQIFLKL
jgi:uncharacterized protein YkwD